MGQHYPPGSVGKANLPHTMATEKTKGCWNMVSFSLSDFFTWMKLFSCYIHHSLEFPLAVLGFSQFSVLSIGPHENHNIIRSS